MPNLQVTAVAYLPMEISIRMTASLAPPVSDINIRRNEDKKSPNHEGAH